MINILRAEIADAKTLTELKIKTFDDDSRRFFNRPSGGPPGYNSIDNQIEMIKKHLSYKILDGDTIIGGIVVMNNGNLCYELANIFIDPDYQGKGIGQQAIRFIENEFPNARKWTLDTPSAATRNHYLYEKMGYIKINEMLLDKTTGLYLYFYEKNME